LQSSGLPVNPITSGAGELNVMLMALDKAIYSGEIELIPDSALLDQLGRYEYWENPHTGQIRYRSMSDHECVIALALALRGLKISQLHIQFYQ